jgi:multidrug efflux pump subunit AcrA (membrane-fusion protein)
MMMTKVKLTAAVLLAVVAAGLGVGLLAFHAWAADSNGGAIKGQVPAEPRPGRVPADKPADTPAPKDYQDVPARQEGVILVIGTELPDKEFNDKAKLDPDRDVVVKVGDTKKVFRKLKVGDKVEAGQMLALIDPVLALDDLAIFKSRVESAKAEYDTAAMTRDEALKRYERLKKLKADNVGAVSEEEIRSAQGIYGRHVAEMAGKAPVVKTAELEMNRAMTVVRQFEVRTGVKGVVTHIHVRPGEAVKKFEPVIRIKIAEEDR